MKTQKNLDEKKLLENQKPFRRILIYSSMEKHQIKENKQKGKLNSRSNDRRDDGSLFIPPKRRENEFYKPKVNKGNSQQSADCDIRRCKKSFYVIEEWNITGSRGLYLKCLNMADNLHHKLLN